VGGEESLFGTDGDGYDGGVEVAAGCVSRAVMLANYTELTVMLANFRSSLVMSATKQDGLLAA
jgi:hypothetical protein